LPKGTLPAVVLPFDPNRTTPVAQITTTPGEVEAFEQVSLYSGVAGFIKRLNVDIGDKVKKGDILAELDVPDLEADYQQKLAVVAQAKAEVEVAQRSAQSVRVAVDTAKLQVQEAEAAIKNAQANLTYRKTQFERMKSLLEARAIDQAILDEASNKLEAAKTAVDAAEAKVKAVKSAVEEAQARYAKAEATVKVAEARLAVAQADAQRSAAQLQFAKVRAPFDGIITRRNFFVGDFAPAPGSGKMQPLLVVARTDLVRVIIHAAENDATRIRVGTPAVIRLDALKDMEFKGKVSRVAGSLEPTNRTLRAEIDLPNSENKILPGMYGTVTLTVEK
ncbi:MAG TPA: efflux RND transporter periplasmic adaptor subunit, partial [Gemmataceae bacterium]|nr:efflux RND transporter periplasmic adaptor subunit [Gemmataceae bacterium]